MSAAPPGRKSATSGCPRRTARWCCRTSRTPRRAGAGRRPSRSGTRAAAATPARTASSRPRTPSAGPAGTGAVRRRSRADPATRPRPRRAATVATSGSSSGHHRSSTYGKVRWPQPIGDSQDSVPLPASPAARSTNAAPMASADRTVDARAGSRSTCTATAVSAANVSPTPATAAPTSSEPSTGSPVPGRRGEHHAPRRRDWPARPAPRAAASGAWRPTRAERISSARPVSSSDAGVPADQEHVHERDDDRPRNAKISKTTSPPMVVEQLRRAAHRDDRGVGAERLPQLGELLRGVVQALAPHRLVRAQERDAEQPPRKPRTVPAAA